MPFYASYMSAFNSGFFNSPYILYLTGQARCSYAASSAAAAIFPAARALRSMFDDAFTSASISRPHKAQLYLFPARASLSMFPQQEQV